jgi:hypothetical protein
MYFFIMFTSYTSVHSEVKTNLSNKHTHPDTVPRPQQALCLAAMFFFTCFPVSDRCGLRGWRVTTLEAVGLVSRETLLLSSSLIRDILKTKLSTSPAVTDHPKIRNLLDLHGLLQRNRWSIPLRKTWGSKGWYEHVDSLGRDRTWSVGSGGM